MDSQLIQVFVEVFKLKGTVTLDQLNSQEISTWDSLKHLKIILAVEQEFNVQFSTDAIPQLVSANAILAELESLGAGVH